MSCVCNMSTPQSTLIQHFIILLQTLRYDIQHRNNIFFKNTLFKFGAIFLAEIKCYLTKNQTSYRFKIELLSQAVAAERVVAEFQTSESISSPRDFCRPLWARSFTLCSLVLCKGSEPIKTYQSFNLDKYKMADCENISGDMAPD